MTQGEENYYKQRFGKYYDELYQTKIKLTQKDKDRIAKRLEKIRPKYDYWFKKTCHSHVFSEADWYKLKYAEAKKREYDGEIVLNEFYLC